MDFNAKYEKENEELFDENKQLTIPNGDADKAIASWQQEVKV